MASVRDYAVLFLGGDKGSAGAGSALGGSVSLETPQHDLDGAEHREATGIDALLATVDHSGLMPPITGDATDSLRGDLTWAPTTTGEVYKRLTDYGAVADDATDSTTEIQAALDDCVPGDTLFVDGQFVIDAPLTWPVNIRLLGWGAAPTWGELPSRIRMTTANTTAISSNVASPNTAKVVLDSVEIAGPGGATSGRGVYSTSDVITRRAIVRGFYDGIYVDDSGANPTAFYTRLEDAWIDDNTRANVYFNTKVNNVAIRGTRLSGGQYGIYCSGGICSGRVEDNAFESYGTVGCYVDGSGAGQSSKGIRIAGSYFEDALGTAIADILLGATATVYSPTIEDNYHNPSASASLWHVDLNHVQRPNIIGGFFGIGAEAGAIRGDPTNTVGPVLVNPGLYGATISFGADVTVIERTAIAPASVGVANAAGTSAYFARADHVHDGSGSGAPTAADYLVGTAQAGLSAEIVVGTTPGGELGGTWSSPTVDATHSGSAHIALSTATPIVESGAGSAGSGTLGSKDDHIHPAAASSGAAHYLVIASGHSTPLVFDDLVQSSAGDDLVYTT